MCAFFSPLNNPNSWAYSAEILPIPQELRYGGYRPRALRAVTGAGNDVKVPGASFLKKYTGTGGHILELQFSPFLQRELAQNLPGGLPTFYFSFPDSMGFGSLNDHALLAGDTLLRTSTSVAIAMMTQDCVVREPVYWAELLQDALSALGEDTTAWNSFLTAISSAFPVQTSPVLILDGQGSLVTDATLDIVYTVAGRETVHTATMIEADNGDLQAAVARMGSLPLSNLWASAGSLVLRPHVAPADRPAHQFARLEDGLEGAGEMEVEPSLRHIQFTHLHDWIAPQFNALGSLARFTRGNKITPFVNGPEFFDELFRQLHTANSNGNGFHHVGYLVKHAAELIKKLEDDPADLEITLGKALERISNGGGKACVLPAVFFQLDPEAPIDEVGVIMLFILFLSLNTLLILYDNDVDIFGVDFARIDTVGLTVVIVLLLSSFVIPAVVPALLGPDGALYDDDGNLIFEKNADVTEFIEGLANGRAILAPYPAEVSDNPSSVSNDLLDIGLEFINRVGIFHQKFSILKNPSGYMAYCGGIDLNENRMDDEYHLAKSPYHDTHAKIEGPAVRDLALNFQNRWQHEGGSTGDLAFSIPDLITLGTPGKQIVQVGNTYFQTTDSTRAFSFAPSGDRTILNTIVQAINQAKEFIYIEDQYFTPPDAYKTALLNKVSSGAIKKLIIMVPDEADQPFGDIEKMGFINDLITADTSGDIVRIGYPRQNYTVTDNKMRASAGKLLLMENLAKDASGPGGEELISLGTGARLPGPPFYFAVEGEIMYAYRMEGAVPSETEEAKTIRQTTRRYYVKRGEALPSMGAKRTAHKKGAAVTVLQYSSIYVHAKTMIIDDIFLSIGSANVNKRGFFHDGETQVFSLPQQLRGATENPIRDLRVNLWAEMLNLPRDLASPILRDPLAAARLFDRSPQQGNRFINLKDRKSIHLLGFTPTTGGGMGMVLETLKVAFTLPDLTYDKFYRTIVDPSTGLESGSP